MARIQPVPQENKHRRSHAAPLFQKAPTAYSRRGRASCPHGGLDNPENGTWAPIGKGTLAPFEQWFAKRLFEQKVRQMFEIRDDARMSCRFLPTLSPMSG